MTNIALLSFGLVGAAFGRCWNWAKEKTMCDQNIQTTIKLSRALARITRLDDENRMLRRQLLAYQGHPASQNGWLSGTQFVGGHPRGGDDETFAEQVTR